MTRNAFGGMHAKAFLFDLDGTLVDTEALWTRAIVDMINARGGSATVDEVLPAVIGRNWMDIDRWVHAHYPEIGASSLETDAEQLRANYRRYATDPASMVIPGSVAFFKAVSAFAPCAIVSGSPHEDIVRAAELCGLADRVSLVLGAGDYAKGKPDPSGYARAAELLKVDPASCVVLEDSTVGVAAGVAAGMKVVAIDRSTCAKQNFCGQTWTVRDLSELDVETFR